MRRREFLLAGAGAAGTLLVSDSMRRGANYSALHEYTHTAPTRSVIPVVGDGHWVWTKPPEGETGYLEPREYELKVGVEITGRGNATQIKATTPAPVKMPEQQIDRAWIEKDARVGAALRAVSPWAGQLILTAPGVVKGQTIWAYALYRLTLHKEYHGYQKDQFPQHQPVLPKDFQKLFLYDSPGIQTRPAEVKELADKVGGQMKHSWDKAKAYYEWVWENIRPREGPYTSVVAALRDRVGDCEEHASVFVALCRVSGIPARLVWVPNHNWAEFFLTDESGRGHWIAAHTSCYSWFGWTGAHELVLQKGDSVSVPEKRKPQRLLEDWMQWQGARPEARWKAELRPLPPSQDADAGPGARSKNERGEWVVVGKHELDPYLRDGARAGVRRK